MSEHRVILAFVGAPTLKSRETALMRAASTVAKNFCPRSTVSFLSLLLERKKRRKNRRKGATVAAEDMFTDFISEVFLYHTR